MITPCRFGALLGIAILGAACQGSPETAGGDGKNGGSPAAGASGSGGGAAGASASAVSGAGGSGGAAGGGSGGGAGADSQADADPAPGPVADASDDPAQPVPPEAGPAPDAAPAARPRGAVCTGGPYEAPRGEGARSICSGFSFKYNWNEGPTWVPAEQAFFFSNFVQRAAGPGDMIKYDPATDRCEVFIEGNGCNGLAVAPDGSLIAACHTPRAVLRYDLATKKSTVVVERVDGRQLDTPNDVVVHDSGTVYFTNPPYELAGRPMGGVGSAVLRIDPAGAVHLVARARVNPLGLSPDQKRLYVAGGYWELDAEGVPLRRAGNFTLGGDGIAVDCAGNVYTQNGAIIGPNNQNVGRFPGGTNMAFGGPDGKTLLIVRGRSAQTLKMNLPGLP